MTRAPGQPGGVTGRERARWEWRWSPGDPSPYAELEAFLVDAGVAVGDLSSTDGSPPGPGALGAAVLVGGGWPLLGHGAAPTPCPQVPDVAAVVLEPAPGEPAAPSGRARVPEWAASWTDSEHAAAVEVVRDAIARGDLYQANVVSHRAGEVVGDPLGIGPALARVPDAPYAGSVVGGGWSVHCASPELFLEVGGGVATTRPIKGTAVRRPGSADESAREGLRTSPKDRAEHVMIVDLERNDLAQVARTGGVVVDELYEVRPLAGLWHAESAVSATLRPGVGLAALLAATFPGGSVTGAPKLAALQQIAALEAVGRGPSMGAIGWVGAGGELTLGLSIRTVAVADGRAHLWTGGGITWSSTAAGEVAEAAAKAAPLIAALG